MLSLSFPTVPENPPHIAHGLPSPVGSRPSCVFGRSFRDRGPGQSPHLHPGPKWEHQGSQWVGEASAWLAVFYQECFHKDESVSTWYAPAWTLCSWSVCGLGRDRQAEGRWTGESWAAVGRITPSIGGGGLCCRLGPQSHYCRHPRC